MVITLLCTVFLLVNKICSYSSSFNISLSLMSAAAFSAFFFFSCAATFSSCSLRRFLAFTIWRLCSFSTFSRSESSSFCFLALIFDSNSTYSSSISSLTGLFNLESLKDFVHLLPLLVLRWVSVAITVSIFMSKTHHII